MAKMMMLVTMLLLLVPYITATNSNLRSFPPNRHHRDGGTTNSSIRTLSTERYNAQRSTWLVQYAGIHNISYSASSNTEWQPSSKPVRDCPSSCRCVIRHDLHDLDPSILVLVVYDCKSSPIRDLAKLFNSHSHVEGLELNACHLSRLPQDILKLHRLNSLYLIKNEFTELSFLQQLPPLKRLFIVANEKHFRIDNIIKLQTLTWLSLAENRITELPPDIGNMKDLEILDVSGNKLQKLPEELKNLRSLKTLDARHNHLLSLPEGLWTLTGLKQLVLSDNQIQFVPDGIWRLTNLVALCIDHNRIQTVPSKGIESMRQLVVLKLRHNQIESLPEEIWGLLSLEQLSLCYNKIQSLPAGLEYLTRLTSLDVSFNELQSVTERTGALTQLLPVNRNLQKLNFSFNKFSTLSLQNLLCFDVGGSLQFITFRNNSIRTIETIDSNLADCLTTGAEIDLANNRISTLDSWPLSVARIKRITLDVSGNHLSRFTNSSGIFLPTFQSGTRFQFQKNHIRHFMDVFDGWGIAINTAEDINTLLKNVYFDLIGNPLACDCVDYEVYRYIHTLRSEQYSNLTCHEPLSLRGQNPHHIPLGSFVCALDVNCPDGCTCVKVPHSQSVNITCGSYNQTDIPEIVPHLPNGHYRYCLDICHQNLTEITFHPFLQKATDIRLSNNSISIYKINSSTAFESLRILHLDNNLLQRLPESVAGMVNGTAVEVRLGSNPWVCDCEAMAMKNWMMLNLYIIKDRNIILCHSPHHMVGVKVMDIEKSTVCPHENKTVVYAVGTISIAVFILFVCVYIVDKVKYHKLRFVGSDECDGEFKEFDIFMSSCSALEDSEYVEDYLIPELERCDFRVLYHREHFNPGKAITDNVSEAIAKSKRTLVFFSNMFRESNMCVHEFREAYHLDADNNTRRLVTITDTHLDMSKLDIAMTHYFKTHTYLERADVHFWKLLEGVLPRKRLGAQVRLF